MNCYRHNLLLASNIISIPCTCILIPSVYCAVGYEVNADGTETCVACERGYYKDNEGDSKFHSCIKCTPNKTTDTKASTSEDQCEFGKCLLMSPSNRKRPCDRCIHIDQISLHICTVIKMAQAFDIWCVASSSRPLPRLF